MNRPPASRPWGTVAFQRVPRPQTLSGASPGVVCRAPPPTPLRRRPARPPAHCRSSGPCPSAAFLRHGRARPGFRGNRGTTLICLHLRTGRDGRGRPLGVIRPVAAVRACGAGCGPPRTPRQPRAARAGSVLRLRCAFVAFVTGQGLMVSLCSAFVKICLRVILSQYLALIPTPPEYLHFSKMPFL